MIKKPVLKVGAFDRKLMRQYYDALGTAGLVASIAILFADPSAGAPVYIGIVALVLFVIACVMLWIRANTIKGISLSVGNSEIEVKFGDLFAEDGLKVIAFNEYFDTLVDDVIISKRSMNGQFIEKFVKDIHDLDSEMEKYQRLRERIVGTNPERQSGKLTKYKIGSLFPYGEYLLTAFSKFDKDNRAYLYMKDYLGFLIEFWNEIDVVYAGRTVAIPLMGSGITRFKDYEDISEQELVELIVISFKLSRVKFQYPSKAKLIIGWDKKNKINLFKLTDICKVL